MKRRRKVATTVYITPEQDEGLKLESARSGLSAAELIRCGIDRELKWSKRNRADGVKLDRRFFKALLVARATRQADLCASIVDSIRCWPEELEPPNVRDVLVRLGLFDETGVTEDGIQARALIDQFLEAGLLLTDEDGGLAVGEPSQEPLQIVDGVG